MASLPDLSIIIVSHNHAPYLTGCLNSLRLEHQPLIHLEIWVVDNCSTDGAAQLVRENFPFVNLLENKTRLGFSANNNRALRQCSGRYVLLLNPDTETQPEALEKWIAFYGRKSAGRAVWTPTTFPERNCTAFLPPIPHAWLGGGKRTPFGDG